jgi:hypothetical protein
LPLPLAGTLAVAGAAVGELALIVDVPTFSASIVNIGVAPASIDY